MRRAAVVGLIALVAACTHRPPSPPAPPSPSPTAAPQRGPLRAEADGTWTRDGQPWKMRLVTVCCKGGPDEAPGDLAKDHKWPLTDVDFLNWITLHKQNATEIRLLMSPRHEGGAFYSPYQVATEDLRVDLERWNPAFWEYVDALLTEAETRGVIVIIGPIDTWPVDHGLSPWCGTNNVNGVNFCSSVILEGPFHEIGRKFTRKTFEETGKHKNVIYFDGNESFEAMSDSWTTGQRDLLREVERERGYVTHPYGTQQRELMTRAAVDFVLLEQNDVARLFCYDNSQGHHCKPTIVNETGGLSPAQAVRNAYRADEVGTSFGYWMDVHDEGQRGKVLIALEGWAKGLGLPDWAKMADECPRVAGIDAKVHLHTFQNRQVPSAIAGGSTIIDATPLFGRTGAGGVCNDEHDHCNGRICEPAGLTWTWGGPPDARCEPQNYAHCDGEAGCNVPCTPGQGYQLRCDREVHGDYWAQPHIDGQTDCYGVRLRPATDGQRVEWFVE